MGVEIERKFLVRDWTPTGKGVLQEQGYLPVAKGCTVRVRVTDESSWLTIKGEQHGLTRDEFEYEVPREDARRILDALCGLVVKKTRYVEHFAGRKWEVDVFHAENEGLVTAEVELESEDDEVELPPWIAEEVSHDSRYAVGHLSRRPYREWEDVG